MRAAPLFVLLASFPLAGCETVNGWFGKKETSTPATPAAAASAPVAPPPVRVLFASGSSALSREAQETLRGFASGAAGKSTAVSVECHADSRGDAKANMALSQRRGQTVKNFLVAQKIEAARVGVSARGEAPASPAARSAKPDPAALAAERRCEVSST